MVRHFSQSYFDIRMPIDSVAQCICIRIWRINFSASDVITTAPDFAIWRTKYNISALCKADSVSHHVTKTYVDVYQSHSICDFRKN